MSIFTRFDIRPALHRAVSSMTEDTADLLIKMAWNYQRIVINRMSGEFEPFTSGSGLQGLPPLPVSGGPPRRVINVE